MYLVSSNTIHSNTASSNDFGIDLYSSSNNNRIYNNYFNNFHNNARDDGSNIWDISPTLGGNIIGGSWLAGNYWSDYAGIDANGDGLGDTLLPYNANGDILIGGDMHPLVPAGIAPLLALKKSDDLDPIPPGGTLNYSIIVNNVGYITTTNVTVTETYDMNVAYDSAMPAPSSGNDMWIFPVLNANESKWINISVIVNPSIPIGTVLHNTVNVSSAEGVTDSDTEATTVFFGEQNCTCGDICVITTGWWRDGGAFHPTDTPIQDAIENAGTGDTICVKDGTYNENVNVDKRLTLKSDNCAASTTVNALYPNEHVFEVTADYVNISGFTVKGATGKGKAGIYLSSSIDHCNIYDNNASDNNYGIYMMESSYNRITSNTVSNNDRYGIYLRRESSNYNTITNNIALNNDYGIRLSHSSNNTIHSNTASSNDFGIDLYSSSNNNRIYNNYFNNFHNNARDDGSNIWDISPTLGGNIIGGSWLAGNYWSDYAGIDANGDGLGDTLLPYNANGDILIGGDMHPLVPAGIAPLLALKKSDDLDPIPPGGTLNYSIIVNNVGYITTTNVTVTETYDMNVAYDSTIPAPSVGNDTWIFPALNANETRWINISVSVNPSTPIGTVLHNIVKVTCDQGVTDTDTEATTVFSGEPNCTCGDICVVTTGWWQDGGAFQPTDTPIQAAIDTAIPSDTICVKDGTYTENVDVDMQLTIRSENGADSTTVNALYPNDHVFEVTGDYVSILGFSVNGATGGGKAGIWLGSNLDHCNISDNKASDNYYGIYMSESSYNTIASNTVSNNYYCGIYMSGSNNNAISSNIVLGSSNGIRLSSSSNNNHIYNNYFNNTENNAQDNGRNIWNIAPTLGQNIIGGYWQGGNYWSDYNGIDANGDGLGDTLLPYTSNGGILKGGDYHPLVHTPSGIELEKWVKYQDESDSEYRKAIENATICNNVSFKIAIRNKGGSIELTNLIVTDVLNCRLRYINGSAIPDTTYANNCPENQTFMWTFSGLEPHEYLNITFDARIVECGNDTNYAEVVAENDAGYTVVDDDTVWVNCTPPVSIETATGTGIASFWTDSGTIEDLVAVAESTLPEEGKTDLIFPHGFFSFNITGLTPGQTVLVTILFPDSLPVGTEYWKYHVSKGGWIRIPMGSDDGDKVITITLVDGGVGDDDGIADGVIVDQGGPGVPLPMLDVRKSSSPTTVAPGGTVTYTIICNNSGEVELTNVTITENYPEGVTFISAVPAPDPGTNNMWTIGVLPVGEFRTITITVKVPESRDLSFTESGSVTGEGFVMVSKDLSTEQEPYTLKNVVTITCAETDPVSASALTTVSGVPGTSLSITEHGSGNYTSEEILDLQTKNKSISLQKSTEAEYQPTSFNFSDSFSVNFTTRWVQDICIKNMVLGDAMHKKIKDATYIKDDTITETGAYGTAMEFDSSFYGAAHIGTVSKDATTSEDYIGEFELYWATREECKYLFNWSSVPGNDSENLIRFLVDNPDINFYWAENATITKSDDDRVITISTDGHSAEVILGTNNETATLKVGTETIYVLEVRTDDGNLNVYDCRLKEMSESVEGEGYVMVDKALSRGQMQVVEHGSGKYTSDTVFDSQRLNKSTEAEYKPTTFNFSDDFGVNFSSKWVQDICSKDKKAGSAIHKRISNAAAVEDDTTATKSSMEFETSFNGSMHIGVRTKGTRISEDYIGLFNITEKIKVGRGVIPIAPSPAPDWLPCPFPEPGVPTPTPASDLSCPSSDP
ncbi:CASH domain-dontaining protein [Methanophagales archaeon]|nr:CASH domain-dontaining protein [Methanophagales archaeon]